MLRRSVGVLCSHLRKGVRNKRLQDLEINIGELFDVEATAAEHVSAEPFEQGLVGGTHVVNDSGRVTRRETCEPYASFEANVRSDSGSFQSL